MTMRAVAAKMIQDRRENRTALISLGIPQLFRFARIPATKSIILHCDTYYLHKFLDEGPVAQIEQNQAAALHLSAGGPGFRWRSIQTTFYATKSEILHCCCIVI
jgi:hypothetical protein